jgi:hypothetical protein
MGAHSDLTISVIGSFGSPFLDVCMSDSLSQKSVAELQHLVALLHQPQCGWPC